MGESADGEMSLRHCVSAGEPLNPEVIDKWYSNTGLTIREGYGQTEMTVSCGMFPCLQVKPGSMGKAAPMYQIHILGELILNVFVTQIHLEKVKFGPGIGTFSVPRTKSTSPLLLWVIFT